jgi:hypothetical protein
VPEFSADVKKKMPGFARAEKKLRYMAVEIYEADKVEDGQPPYRCSIRNTWAIALLGRDSPAVAGTKLTLFSMMSGGVLNTVNEEEKTCRSQPHERRFSTEWGESSSVDVRKSHP